MKRMLVAIFAILIVFSIIGCSNVNWSVSPYVGVYGNTDKDVNDGLNWNAGVSMTFYNHLPAVPAVPAVYQTRADVYNNVSSSSNSSSSQSQNQGQNQNNGGNGGGGNGGGDNGGKKCGKGHENHDHNGKGKGHCEDDD